MNNKERIKQKQLAKKKAKEEKEKIIDKYMSATDDILNEQFKKIDNAFTNTVRLLDEGYAKYQQLLTEINAIVKDETIIDLDLFEEKLKEISEFVKQLDSKVVKTNQAEKEKVTKIAIETSKQCQEILEQANNALIGNKNQHYIISLLFTRCQKLMKEYISFTMEKNDEINAYIDMFEESRNSLAEYLAGLIQEIKEHSKQQKLERSNERLRVEYKQLKKFLEYKGYEFDRQNASTHAIWKNPITGKSVPLPNKSKTVPQGTVSSVLRKINSNRNELVDFLILNS